MLKIKINKIKAYFIIIRTPKDLAIRLLRIPMNIMEIVILKGHLKRKKNIRKNSMKKRSIIKINIRKSSIKKRNIIKKRIWPKGKLLSWNL